eukprot:CAMPEP_0194241016 /NCGR_PEP_ID=MMETSP0158-20130606/7012_1 /TAXON_ID=33649 /ORGANISM="Thalassionema nitzschioides, Strain L26-B" /LENGTH=117 /DNA_ID=CAMNT_0038975833 /DNA_START=356 /DNA_END=705 /DNA_ORIENTATION=-
MKATLNRTVSMDKIITVSRVGTDKAVLDTTTLTLRQPKNSKTTTRAMASIFQSSNQEQPTGGIGMDGCKTDISAANNVSGNSKGQETNHQALELELIPDLPSFWKRVFSFKRWQWRG